MNISQPKLRSEKFDDDDDDDDNNNNNNNNNLVQILTVNVLASHYMNYTKKGSNIKGSAKGHEN